MAGSITAARATLQQWDLRIARGGRGGQFGFSRTIVSPQSSDRGGVESGVVGGLGGRWGSLGGEQLGELLVHGED